MSKARTPITSQRDLLHFIANPPPAPVPRAIPAELIRISGKPPATSNTTIEKAIEAITTGKDITFTFPVSAVPVTTRAAISSRMLEGALNTCKLASKEITLEFSPRGLRFATIDGDHTMMCRVTIAPEAFTEFDAGNTTNTIRVDLKSFVRTLARAGKAKGRDIQLRVGTGGAAMSVAFHMGRGIRNTIAFTPVSTRMITSQDAGTGLFSMDLKVPPCTLLIDRITFLDALKDARLCCRILQARVEGNLLHLASTEVEDGYNTAIPVAFTGDVLEGNFDLGTFSTRDLAQVATALRAFKQPTITLRAGSHTLLVFCVEMKGLALEFSLAPRISRPGDDIADEEEDEHDDGDGTEPDHEYQREDAAPPAADTTTDEAATTTPKET